ncbi:condensation domain-containing protein [Micromonospora sp. DT62]|uniref:condensation domain-containing protein n=1 Tax=Micromonospora sp. DT62 TaxID=3416521 RepID=UPI003CF336CF
MNEAAQIAVTAMNPMTLPSSVSVVQENRLLREIRARRAGLETYSYLVQTVLEVDASVDLAAIEAALTRVAERHDVLRTAFVLPEEGEEIAVAVAPAVRPRLTATHLAGLSAEERIEQATTVQNELLVSQVELTRAPLWHGRVLTFDEHPTLVILVVEHMVCDGHSRAVLAEDFAAELDRHRSGVTAPRPRPDQYATWVDWQRRMLAGPEGEELIGFWREHLAGTVPFPPLNAPEGDPEAPTEWAAERVEFAGEQRDGLLALARSQGLTAYMVYLALIVDAWARVTGQHDFVVHSPCANRTTDVSERVVGWLAHSIPMRWHDLPRQTPSELFRSVRSLVRDTMSYQDLPLPMMTRTFQPDSHGRARRRERLYYSYLLQQTQEWAMESGGKVRLIDLPEQDPTSDSDLSIIVRDVPERTTVSIEFNPRQIAAGFIAEFAEAVRESMLKASSTRPS